MEQPRYIAQATTPTYTLGAGDQIRVDVFDAPEYTGDYQVLPDGTVSLPMVGVVSIAGLSLEGAAEVISGRLGSILRRPITTVQLVAARPIAVAIAGEINRPGAYTITTEDMAGTPTITKAIQLAGGITQRANIRDIQVLRVDPQTQNPTQVVTANLWQLLKEGRLEEDIALQNGDRILIPEAVLPDHSERSVLSTSNIAPATMTINVVGEVGQPGSLNVPSNILLNQAILSAGGFSRRARKGRVELVRLNPNGSVTKQDIEVDLSADADSPANPPLQPNDTVIVNRSTFTQVTDTLSQAVRPLGGLFSIFRLFDD